LIKENIVFKNGNHIEDKYDYFFSFMTEEVRNNVLRRNYNELYRMIVSRLNKENLEAHTE